MAAAPGNPFGSQAVPSASPGNPFSPPAAAAAAPGNPFGSPQPRPRPLPAPQALGPSPRPLPVSPIVASHSPGNPFGAAATGPAGPSRFAESAKAAAGPEPIQRRPAEPTNGSDDADAAAIARLLPMLRQQLLSVPAGVVGVCEKMGGRAAIIFGKSRQQRWFVVDGAELRYYYNAEAATAGRRCPWEPSPGGRYPLIGASLQQIDPVECAVAFRLECSNRTKEDFFFKDATTADVFFRAVRGAISMFRVTIAGNTWADAILAAPGPSQAPDQTAAATTSAHAAASGAPAWQVPSSDPRRIAAVMGSAVPAGVPGAAPGSARPPHARPGVAMPQGGPRPTSPHPAGSRPRYPVAAVAFPQVAARPGGGARPAFLPRPPPGQQAARPAFGAAPSW